MNREMTIHEKVLGFTLSILVLVSAVLEFFVFT